jgi:hypothetical protein
MPPSLSWKFSEKEFTKQMKDVKLFVKCIQAITLNQSLLLCGFASLREISMSDFRCHEVTQNALCTFVDGILSGVVCAKAACAAEAADLHTSKGLLSEGTLRVGEGDCVPAAQENGRTIAFGESRRRRMEPVSSPKELLGKLLNSGIESHAVPAAGRQSREERKNKDATAEVLKTFQVGEFSFAEISQNTFAALRLGVKLNRI